MTRVGLQFTCNHCGYESRISPSCVGGVDLLSVLSEAAGG